MNKSIYDEALKELRWLLHDEIDDNPKRSRLSVSERLNMFKKVKDVLEQAKKQEELLELYIKIYNGITDYHDYDELKEIQKQIKELENE